MARKLGVQVGLLAFGVALVAGLYVGNSSAVILTRALMAMVLGVIIGQVAGWAARQVLRDHLQKIKLRIDREHLAAVELLNGAIRAQEEPGVSPEASSAETAQVSQPRQEAQS